MDDNLTTNGGDACPVCAAPAERRIELGDYALWACTHCGCWSSDALVRGARISFEPTGYFNNADADRDKWLALSDRLAAQSLPVCSVLDVGCGSGAYLSFAAKQYPGAKLVGVELDEQRAGDARERNPGAEIHAGDALATVEALEGRFDLITLWDVFEHLKAPTRLLDGLARLLAPGGSIYVQTIHEDSLLPRIGRLSYALTAGKVTYPARRTHEPHHLVFFSRRGLDHAAATAGLEIGELWFDRLVRDRMDGSGVVTWLASTLLRAENAIGNGLFVSILLRARSSPGAHRTPGRVRLA